MSQLIEVPGMGQVEFPDNMSDDQIVAAIKRNAPKAVKPAPASALKGYSPLLETVKDLPQHYSRAVGGIAQGAGDLAVGAGQLVSEGAGVLGATDFRDRFRNYMQQREGMYQGGRGDYSDKADIGRVTGSVLAGAPAAAGAPALSLGGRIFQGAKVGGVTGLTSPVKPDDDFWLAKGVQTTASTALGAAAPPLVEGLVKGAGAAVNALTNSVRGAGQTLTPQTVENTLRVELQRAGVDWNALSQQRRDSLLGEVRSALGSGGRLDPDQIRRLADFERVGAEPLKGQLSRVPEQFAREQNLARTAIGGPLAERIGQQNTAFINRLPQADQYSAGQTVLSSLTGRDAPRRAAVTSAYDTARAEAGIESNVPLQPVAQRIGQLVEDFGDDKIPGAVMKRLNEFGILSGEQTRVFNIREAEKLKTLIGNNIDNPQTPTGKALTLLRHSVDDAVNSLADVEGAQAAHAFRQARGQAASRFQNIERTPALGAALEGGVAPEKFVEKFAIRGEINDVANFMRNLDPAGRQATRQGVMDWLRSKAVHGEGDSAKFSQSGFNTAMQTIGDRKLDLIFAGDRNTLQTLRALGRASGNAMNAPPAAGVNYSGSGTTILDAMDRASGLPFLGALKTAGSDVARAHQVSTALTGAPVTAATPALSPALINRLARDAGLFGILGGPLAATNELGLR